MPAKELTRAGGKPGRASSSAGDWIPACAGMTKSQFESKCEPELNI